MVRFRAAGVEVASRDRRTIFARRARPGRTERPPEAMRPRIPQLDGLRGLAILAVLAWHLVAAPLGTRAGPLALAWAGVDLFFVLSGYLIADILLKARPAANYFRVFYLRRACRLLPLYALTLIAFAAARAGLADRPSLAPLFEPGEPPLWTYAAFVQNLGMAAHATFGPGWLAVTWSLAVEVQFYLLLPLLVRYARPSTLPAVAVASLVAGPLVRALLPPVAGYVSLVSRADSFFAGVLVAYALWEPACAALAQAARPLAKLGFVAFAAGVGVMAVRPEAFGAVKPWYGTFTHTWLALTFALLLFVTLTDDRSRVTRVLSLWPLRRLGAISYGVYLTHQPIHRLTFGLLTDAAPQLDTAGGVGLTLLTLGLTVGVSASLAATVERGFIALGRRARYTDRTSVPLTDTPPPRRPAPVAPAQVTTR